MKSTMIKFGLGFSIILIFTGCASTYGPRGSMGGYEEKSVGENMYEVRFYGNQHTPADQMTRMLLYRCAELTRDKGFDSFLVLNDQSFSEKTVNNPTLNQPGVTRESASMGVRTVIMPDLTQPTESTNWIGVYIISMYNQGDTSYSIYSRSRLDADQILTDYKQDIR